MDNGHNRSVYKLVDSLLESAGFAPDSSVRHHLGNLDFHVGDAEIARLRAELAERDAEVARLTADNLKWQDDYAALLGNTSEQPRTDAEWKAADRKKRINDLAARYAGVIAFSYDLDDLGEDPRNKHRRIVRNARALAAAVVEAEE